MPRDSRARKTEKISHGPIVKPKDYLAVSSNCSFEKTSGFSPSLTQKVSYGRAIQLCDKAISKLFNPSVINQVDRWFASCG